MLHQLEEKYRTTFTFGLESVSKGVRKQYMKHAIGSEGEITGRIVSLNKQKIIDR